MTYSSCVPWLTLNHNLLNCWHRLWAVLSLGVFLTHTILKLFLLEQCSYDIATQSETFNIQFSLMTDTETTHDVLLPQHVTFFPPTLVLRYRKLSETSWDDFANGTTPIHGMLYCCGESENLARLLIHSSFFISQRRVYKWMKPSLCLSLWESSIMVTAEKLIACHYEDHYDGQVRCNVEKYMQLFSHIIH